MGIFILYLIETQQVIVIIMKNKLILALAVVVIALVFGGLIIAYGNLYKKLREKEDSDFQKSDTVYVEKFYSPKKEYSVVSIPKLVTFYLTDTVEVERVELRRDTIRLTYRDSNYLEVNSNYLTQYPQNDKLIQMLVDNRNLSLVLLNTSGQVYQKAHSVDFTKYDYNYFDNQLTFKKKNFFHRLQPFVEFTARPIHNNWDLGMGINYKTSKINYELGLNGYYYSLNQKPWNYDVFFRVRYNFN